MQEISRDAGSIPGLGRSPGGGYGNPLQYTCLENPMDRGAWKATAQRVTKSWTWLKGLSTHTPLLCRLIGRFGVPVSLAHPLQHAYLVPGLSPRPLLARQKFQSILDLCCICAACWAAPRPPNLSGTQTKWGGTKLHVILSVQFLKDEHTDHLSICIIFHPKLSGQFSKGCNKWEK